MNSKFIFLFLFSGLGLLTFGFFGSSNLNADSQAPNPGQVILSRDAAEENKPGSPDVIYVPTPQPVVDEMLRLANVKSNDVVYDLGSGDGRIVITAAKEWGARGIGIDIDPQRVLEANENAKKAKVTDRVKFLQQDLFQTNLSEATVVTLYLLPELNLRLRPKLFKELKPGTRVVSHAFDMGDWKPEKVVQIDNRTIYFWIIPDKIPENLQTK